jgi:hypothetical protein
MAIEKLKRNKDLLEGRLLAQIMDINAKDGRAGQVGTTRKELHG